MAERVRYRGFIADSARWDGFVLRDDDVIISTPAKSGTTWMQTIVALLLFDGVPDEPVYELSPWLDMHVRTIAETEALLGAQTHRRFIKTHAPLDGLPDDERVTYISVGRDPRDVLVSSLAHLANMDTDTTRARRIEVVGDDDLDELVDRWPDSDDPRQIVEAFIELDRDDDHTAVNLANVLHHLAQAWAVRDRPNHVLVHYADLTADLPGEMARVRDALGLATSDDRVRELAHLATFDSMRSRAATTAPEASMGIWRDAATFFRAGRRGEGTSLMTEDERRRYAERCRELVADDAFLSWVHGGRSAADVGTG